MGKIVKYCAACEEGFAEKFGFCPNCGAHLTAFEMNPVVPPIVAAKKTEPVEEPKAEPLNTNKLDAATPGVGNFKETPREEIAQPETAPSFLAEKTPVEAAPPVEEFEPEEEEIFEPAPVVEPKVSNVSAASNENLYQATYAKPKVDTSAQSSYHYVPDDSFHVTVVEEKDGGVRNLLLLGAAVLTVTFFSSGVVYSMFSKYLDIAAIETPELVAYVDEVDEPVEIEEEEPKKEEDKGGGGGGGGKDEPTPASKGREATQVDKPLFAPSSKMTQVTNPDIPIQAATQGDRKAPITPEPYGLRNGADGLSDGMGTGGGLGNGRGRGQGNGNGTGLGNGNGSGFGNGNGNGNGDGDGDGDGDAEKLVVKQGVSSPLKILSKPRASYTDAARQQQVTGTVVLRVTFLASGQIGSISPVRGLPNGLTEQAIAAARGIRFEPAKKNGSAVSVTKTIEYSFTIY